MVADIFQHADLPFPKSLPGFQKLFPNDAACATYEKIRRWMQRIKAGAGQRLSLLTNIDNNAAGREYRFLGEV